MPTKRTGKSKEREGKEKEIVRFTETHEWIRISGQEGVLGLTLYAVKKLTDLVHVELPEVGQQIEQGVPFGEIESVKAVSELNAPVSGEVLETNHDVLTNIELISEDPMDEGWLIKVTIENPEELDSLMTKEEYDEYVRVQKEELEEE